MNVFDPLPQHRVLSIMPTFQCTAECTHCGSISNPREKTRLSIEDLHSAIDQAGPNAYQAVVFTGGEATLVGNDLLIGIRRAVSYKLPVRVVTNAYWAVNDKAADQRVANFVNAGLTEINFSTGDQHATFVPIERVIRATRASLKAGLPVSIMIERERNSKITKGTLTEHTEFRRLLHEFPSAGIGLLESPWMPLVASDMHEYDDGAVSNRSNLATRRGCENILSTTTIEADGNIGACCGIAMRQIPELLIGNIREKSLADADQLAADDFLKRWIRVDGPEFILAWAASYDPEILWENMYAHRCQACLRLYKDPRVRQVIVEHHKEKIGDVLLAEWLLFHYKPNPDN